MYYIIVPERSGDERGSDDGYGLKIRAITTLYLEWENACLAAEQLSKDNPGKVYHILKSTHVVESLIPEITTICKQFNDKGEVVPL